MSTEIIRLKRCGWTAKFQISTKKGPHGMKKPQVRGTHSHEFLAIDAIRYQDTAAHVLSIKNHPILLCIIYVF